MNDAQPAEPRILVVDVETTGLDPEKCSLLDIGAQWLMGGEGHFSMQCRMWEGAEWTEEAEQVHGISIDAATNPILPTEAEAVLELVTWLGEGDVILAGLNPRLDLGFIHAALMRALGDKFKRAFSHRTLDLHTLAVTYVLAKGEFVPSWGLGADAICKALGMPEEPRPHRAVSGVIWETEAFRILMGIPIATEPIPYAVVPGAEWGVYAVNDCDWMLARSPQEAREGWKQFYSYPADEEPDDLFPLDEVRMLEVSELNTRQFRLESGGTVPFMDELQRRREQGIQKPDLFASTEV